MSRRSVRVTRRVDYRRLARGLDQSESEEEEHRSVELAEPEDDDGENSPCEDELEAEIEDSESSAESDLGDDHVQPPQMLPQQVADLVAPDGTIWSKDVPAPRQTPPHNIIRFRPGPKPVTAALITKKEVLNTILTSEILEKIVFHTNEWAWRVVDDWNINHLDPMEWRNIDVLELEAFIGLLLLAGVERAVKQPLKEFWAKDLRYSKPPFQATMSKNRFMDILRMLRFDDVNARRERKRQNLEVDKDAPIKEVFSLFNATLPHLYEPGQNVTVDETLVKFRGKCPFRVYIKSKPGRYGIKLWSGCDSSSFYIFNMQIYTGKQDNQREVDQGRRVVMDMVAPVFGTGRGVTGDNFFSGVGLVNDLMAQNLSYTGTLRKNRKEVPRELTHKATVKARPEHSSEFLFSGDMTMVSYIPKKNRSVIMLTTEFHDDKVDADHANKPEIILHYNDTKAGVDAFDQMVSEYTCQRPSRRWPMKIFFHLVDSAALNAAIVWMGNNSDWMPGHRSKRRIFIRELAEELITPAIIRRSSKPGLHSYIRDAMKKMGITAAVDAAPNVGNPPPAPDLTHGRCKDCAGPARKRKNSRTRCNDCQAFLCQQHQQKIVLCAACSMNLAN